MATKIGEKISKSDLNELVGYLRPIIGKWREIGTHLGLSTEELDKIAKWYEEQEQNLMMLMLMRWLQNAGTEATWEDLYHVLEQNVAGGREVAEAMQKKGTESLPFLGVQNIVMLSKFQLSCDDDHPPMTIARYRRSPTIQYPVLPMKFPPSESFPVQRKNRITLECETKKIKKEFSTLLLSVLNILVDTNPQEVVALLSCYDDRYSTLVKQCEKMEDIIQVLTTNVSFLDYDLLQFVLGELKDNDTTERVESYSQTLQQYLERRIYAHRNDPDKLMLPVDSQMGIAASNIRQKKRLKFIAENITKKEIELEEFSKLGEERIEAIPTELRGVEVLEEAKLFVTNSSQLFDWKGYGLKLQIPEKSLPTAVESCTITIEATLAGQYQFPHNTELVSPVFWLRCEPQCRFNAPLTLSIQHCALPRNSFRLFITRAQCTQKDLPYSFKVLHGGTFSKHSSYGIIELNQFSGVAVVQERSEERPEERRYWSSVYYMGPPNNREIHFTVTWHDDVHITTVNKKYSRRNATVGPEQPITFKDTKVTLAIPREGLVLQEKWQVLPATPPKIEKRDVDDHQLEEHLTTVPHCELVAMWSAEDKQTKPLIHTVDILGTEEEEKYFTINIDPSQQAVQSRETETKNTSNRPLQIQHLYAIKECLKLLSRDKIIDVGLALGLLYPNLRNMTTLPEDMIQAWLEKRDNVLGQSGEPTVQSLITALESSGLAGTVDTVRSKFIT